VDIVDEACEPVAARIPDASAANVDRESRGSIVCGRTATGEYSLAVEVKHNVVATADGCDVMPLVILLGPRRTGLAAAGRPAVEVSSLEAELHGVVLAEESDAAGGGALNVHPGGKGKGRQIVEEVSADADVVIESVEHYGLAVPADTVDPRRVAVHRPVIAVVRRVGAIAFKLVPADEARVGSRCALGKSQGQDETSQ